MEAFQVEVGVVEVVEQLWVVPVVRVEQGVEEK
jgi:hypothetical protein